MRRRQVIKKDSLLGVTSSEVEFPGQDKNLSCVHEPSVIGISGIRAVNFSEMNQKVGLDDERLCEGPVNKKLKTGTGVETECSISRRDTSASRYSGAGPGEEKKRIVFPLDLNEGKDDDDEMVDNNPRPQGNDNSTRRSLGMVPNLDLALGEEKTRPTMTTTTGVVLPFMGGTSSTEEHRSSRSQKPQDGIMNQDDDAASLSLSLSFSSLEKGQQQQQKQQNERSLSGWEGKKQNVNTPLFLFRDFPDKSS